MMKIVAIGEAMLELSTAGEDLWRSGIAGDTFNTAVYLKALQPNWRVSYATGLGSDAFSLKAAAAFQERGLVPEIKTHETRGLGLYAISLDNGERSFTYWRSQSAARCLAEDPEWLNETLKDVDAVYLSGITLAILEGSGRDNLLSALKGHRVIFDPNIRPRLWESPEAMRQYIAKAAALSEISLPSFDDEAAAFGDATPVDTAQRYRAYGVREVIVKNGEKPLVASFVGELSEISPPEVVSALDTTGAGDSFNAGYLAARLAGATIAKAVASGQRLSCQVVQHKGAIMPDAVLATLA